MVCKLNSLSDFLKKLDDPKLISCLESSSRLNSTFSEFSEEKFLGFLVKKFEKIKNRVGSYKAAAYIVDEIPEEIVHKFLDKVNINKKEIISKNTYLLSGTNSTRQSKLFFQKVEAAKRPLQDPVIVNRKRGNKK